LAVPEPGWQAAQAAVGLPDVADAWSFEAAALEEAISNVLEAARLLDVPRCMFVWYTMGRARRALATQRARWEGRYGVEPPDPLPPAFVAEVRNAVDSIGEYQAKWVGGRRKGNARGKTKRRRRNKGKTKRRRRNKGKTKRRRRS